jgi:iron(III) transport system permease protein
LVVQAVSLVVAAVLGAFDLWVPWDWFACATLSPCEFDECIAAASPSLTHCNPSPDYSVAVLWDPQTWWATLRTVGFGALVATLCVGLALPLAWCTHCTDLPYRRFFQVALNLPLAVPSYVSAYVIVATLGHGGWLHWLVEPLGVATMPDLRGPLGATLALLWCYPFALLLIQAALARTDPRLWEAALSLGLTPGRAFRTVVLPHLRPALAAGALLIALYAVSDFGAVSLLRFKTLSFIIYLRHDSVLDTFQREAVFLSVLLVAVAVLFVAGIEATRGKVTASLTSQAGHRTWPVVRLGVWRLPATLFCGAVVLLGVALPVVVVLWWLGRGVALGHEIQIPWSAAGISAGLAIGAALLAVGAATVPALLGRFGHSSEAKTVRRAALMGYALPGIVVGLALVSLVTSHAFVLYQTTALLVAAYIIRFVPLALDTLGESLLAQNRRIYDAARSLGCTPTSAVIRVVLPMSRPAMWAGFLAVMIAVIKELPITLMLAPIQIDIPGMGAVRFDTLAMRIWTLTVDEFLSQVAPVVLILLVLAAGGLLLRPDTARLRP